MDSQRRKGKSEKIVFSFWLSVKNLFREGLTAKIPLKSPLQRGTVKGCLPPFFYIGSTHNFINLIVTTCKSKMHLRTYLTGRLRKREQPNEGEGSLRAGKSAGMGRAGSNKNQSLWQTGHSFLRLMGSSRQWHSSASYPKSRSNNIGPEPLRIRMASKAIRPPRTVLMGAIKAWDWMARAGKDVQSKHSPWPGFRVITKPRISWVQAAISGIRLIVEIGRAHV